MTRKKFKKIFENRICQNVCSWLAIILTLSAILSFSIGVYKALLVSALIFLPVIPAVYINFFLFKKHYLQGKYLLYFLLALANVILFGFAGEIAANLFYNKPGDNLGSIAYPLIMVLITLGIKNFRDSINTKIRIEEAISKQAQAELKLKNTESLQIAAELDVLRAQINPHFLFNTLNSIYSLAIDRSEDTPKAIMLLSKLFRYQLEDSQKKKVPIIREIDFISDYIELEKLRLGDSCKIIFQKDQIDESYPISPFILFPFVENCFKHGIGLSSKDNFIKLLLSINNGTLFFETSNSIPPVNQTDINKEGKTGIENVRKRLEILYPEKYILDITRENKVFKVKLNIT